MGSIFFQLSGLFHIIIIEVVYFTKKKINTLENFIFKSLIICTFVTIVFDILSIYMGINYPNNAFTIPVCKYYLWGTVTWAIIATFYVFVITSPKNESKVITDEHKNIGYFQKRLKITSIANVLILTVIYFLPLKSNNLGTSNFYISGISVLTTCGIAGVSVFLWLIMLVKNFKNINNAKKFLIVAFSILTVTGGVIFLVKPDLLLSSAVIAFMTTLIFFTLENPDLQLIENLNIAKKQAETANRAKTDFLSSMSHEIRTPLNAIVGFSQALAKEDISGAAKDEVKDILIASNNLLEIVNGILDVSKIEANKIEIVNKDYSFNKLINEITNLTNSRLGSKQLEFKIEIDEKIPPVLYGDSVRIKQVLVNLLTNAVKYTKTGYIKLKVDSAIQEDKVFMTYIVEDTGVGMTPKDLELLFTKFQRFDIDKNVNIAGTGLGMAITKGLVELMNGTVTVESEYGKGSRFTIKLEQKISNKPLTDFDTEVKTANITPFDATGKRVLVVDDNKINLKVASRLLREYNIDVELVDNGAECINRVLDGKKYDLIFLDIMMPKMKGPEVVHNLNNIVGFNIPVIALTADVITGMEEKYTEQGFNDCLPKPIVEEELYYMLKKFIQPTTNKVPIKKENDIYNDNDEINLEEIEKANSSAATSDIVKEKVEERTPVVEEETIVESTPAVELPIINDEFELPRTKEEAVEEHIEQPEVEENPVTEMPVVENTPEQVSVPVEEVEIVATPTDGLTGVELLEANGINVSAGLELLKDMEMYNMTLEEFYTELPEKLENLKEFKENKDMDNYGILAHGLKSEARYVGCNTLGDIAYEHELAGKDYNQEYVEQRYDELATEANRLYGIIKRYFNE